MLLIAPKREVNEMNIEEVYGKLACIKKENEMYVSYIYNCKNGYEKIYMTSQKKRTIISNLKKNNLIPIPKNIFEEEGKRLRSYLNRS
ncbi:hypothetical protein CLONEX_01272 [[Clostridium] nexile DSM 1787]|nr:hypothetical protein CLONEX_01272 [[Clostridium] nexile DSM 1787]